MTPELHQSLLAALERSHRLGTIGGELEDQLAHCASFSSVLAQFSDPPFHAADLGTGGGLPGVVLSALLPHTDWTLIDLRSARTTELERVVLQLGLQERVRVLSGDVQALAHGPEHREQYEAVVARAFGPPSMTLECGAGMTKVGGCLITSEPPDGQPDRWHAASVAALGFSGPQILTTGLHRFAVFQKVSACPPRAPRRTHRMSRGWFADPG